MTLKPTSDAVAVTQEDRDLRHEVCELIEAYCPNYDSDTGIPVGSEVEQLADLILGAVRASRLASTRPMTEDVAGLVDDFTSALRLGVEDDVTIPFDLAVRIHAALSAKPEAGEGEVERYRAALDEIANAFQVGSRALLIERAATALKGPSND